MGCKTRSNLVHNTLPLSLSWSLVYFPFSSLPLPCAWSICTYVGGLYKRVYIISLLFCTPRNFKVDTHRARIIYVSTCVYAYITAEWRKAKKERERGKSTKVKLNLRFAIFLEFYIFFILQIVAKMSRSKIVRCNVFVLWCTLLFGDALGLYSTAPHIIVFMADDLVRHWWRAIDVAFLFF